MVNLPKIIGRRNKRVGRGIGSGKGGHTSGRGQKGQKSRDHIGVLFEGIKMKKSFIKKLPLRRGRGKFGPKDKPIVINLGDINYLPAGTRVDLEFLIKQGIVEKGEAVAYGVKILGGGNLTKKLTIDLPISKSAASKLESAGGKAVFGNPKGEILKAKKA